MAACQQATVRRLRCKSKSECSILQSYSDSMLTMCTVFV